MSITVARREVARMVVRGSRTAVVQMKPTGHKVSVVQSASPIPISGGSVADPGDLTLIFDNRLI